MGSIGHYFDTKCKKLDKISSSEVLKLTEEIQARLRSIPCKYCSWRWIQNILKKIF